MPRFPASCQRSTSKVLKVVVKLDVGRAGTQVLVEKGRVGCEDRGDIDSDVRLPTERNGDRLLEMCHDGGTGHERKKKSARNTVRDCRSRYPSKRFPDTDA